MSVLSCAKPPAQSGTPRIAILPFENLTGDASLDWVQAAGRFMVGEELDGSLRAAPVQVNSMEEVRLSNAPQVLHTYYTKEHGVLLLNAQIEDRRTRRIQPLALSGTTLLSEVNDLTHHLDRQARAFSTSNPAAVEAWGSGDFEKALSLDPDFGAAWISRIRDAAKAGHTDEAAKLADEALARKNLRSESSRSELRTISATLHKDFSAEANVLTDRANQTPTDSSALAAAAQAQTMARNFPAAVELYQKLRAVNPQNQAVLNSLGYAEGFAGNVEAAAKVMADYAKLPDSEVNAHDSMGEIYFMNGHFREAEQEFTKAYSLDPNFLKGAPALKAAYAHWLAGDLSGADAMVQKIVTPIVKNSPPAALWRQATWLYSTGRQEEAIKMLSTAPHTGTPTDELFSRQLALWKDLTRLPSDLDRLRSLYFSTAPGQDSGERIFYAAALVAAGKDAEAKAILTRWPLPEASRNETILDSLIFPKYLELRKKLQLK